MKRIFLITTLITCLFSCESPEEIEEVIVIGGGLIESSTAWQLSKNGEHQ